MTVMVGAGSGSVWQMGMALQLGSCHGRETLHLVVVQDTTVDLQSLQSVLDKAFEAAGIRLRQPAEPQTEQQPEQQPEQHPEPAPA